MQPPIPNIIHWIPRMVNKMIYQNTNLVPLMMKNYDTEDPVETSKALPSAAQVFQVLNFLILYHQFICQVNHQLFLQ